MCLGLHVVGGGCRPGVHVLRVRLLGCRAWGLGYHLTQCIHQMVLESQLLHEIVNLLYSKLIANQVRSTADGDAHGGLRPFHRKPTCLTQLTVRPFVEQIRLRCPPELGENEAL